MITALIILGITAVLSSFVYSDKKARDKHSEATQRDRGE